MGKSPSAAVSGETLSRARAKFSLPAQCNLAELRRRLEQTAGDSIVDITFEELSGQMK